jgi:hypothetical protein
VKFKVRIGVETHAENGALMKIRAIKAVRDAFGFGLREAKCFVERAIEGAPIIVDHCQLVALMETNAIAGAEATVSYGAAIVKRGVAPIYIASIEPNPVRPLELDVTELSSGEYGRWDKVYGA